MKGAMMRALDSSSSDLMLFAPLQRIFLETSSLCYPRTLFRHALLELAEKYRIFSQYTQIVKLWENSEQHTDWDALQRKARVFSADERCFSNSSRRQYNRKFRWPHLGNRITFWDKLENIFGSILHLLATPSTENAILRKNLDPFCTSSPHKVLKIRFYGKKYFSRTSTTIRQFLVKFSKILTIDPC